jgi:hypothetical protein
MEIVSSRIVAEASELPSLVLLLTAAVGPLLWVLGWRFHRGLFVAASTFVGGMYGLAHGSAFGLYPAVAAGLMSLSAGGLAMAAMRIGVFVVFGAVLELAVRTTIAAHVDEQAQAWLRVSAFFIGGLSSLLCYRFLVIAFTSLLGAYLLLVGGMAFALRQGEFDSAEIASGRPILVSSIWVGLGLAGIAGQYVLEKIHVREKRRTGDAATELLRKLLKSKSAN